MLTLITGATGFVGHRLAERLVADGGHVRVFVRDPTRLSTNLQDCCEIVPGDLEDASSLSAAVTGVHTIYHCAANVRTWDSLASYRGANVVGVRNLLRAVIHSNPDLHRLIHLSTVDVYGYPDDPCDENCPLDGAGFGYGETKLAGEQVLRELASEAGISFTIIRPTNVMGPGSPFIDRIGDALSDGLMLKIDGGQANAGIVDIDNLIDYLCWAASSSAAVGETFNVRDDYDENWCAFLDELKRRIGGKGRIINLPYGLALAAATIFESMHRLFLPEQEPLLHRMLVGMFGKTCGHSAQKLREYSGIHSRIGFDECMARSAAWYRATRER